MTWRCPLCPQTLSLFSGLKMRLHVTWWSCGTQVTSGFTPVGFIGVSFQMEIPATRFKIKDSLFVVYTVILIQHVAPGHLCDCLIVTRLEPSNENIHKNIQIDISSVIEGQQTFASINAIFTPNRVWDNWTWQIAVLPRITVAFLSMFFSMNGPYRFNMKDIFWNLNTFYINTYNFFFQKQRFSRT